MFPIKTNINCLINALYIMKWEYPKIFIFHIDIAFIKDMDRFPTPFYRP